MYVLGGDLRIAKELIELGVSADGHGPLNDQSESPLCVAIESNQFELADFLRKAGAKINALSNFISRPQIQLSVPTTALGRIIAANIRYSSHRIRERRWNWQSIVSKASRTSLERQRRSKKLGQS